MTWLRTALKQSFNRASIAFGCSIAAAPLLCTPHAALAQSAAASVSRDTMPTADRIRIAEAFRLAAAVGDSVWHDWSTAPFALLLVTATHEFLVRHPAPSPDFAHAGYDSIIKGEVFVRPRVYQPTLRATFPAVGGVPTIVVGQADATDRSSTRWVLTVLHEHFHQLQYAHPGYTAGVDALKLDGGDSTGMWMLNFPFPYDAPVVQARFNALSRRLARALTTPVGGSRARPSLRPVAVASAELRAAVPAAAYRYFDFQLWQEGVARYTELRVARLADAASYTPCAAFRALPDYASYATARTQLEAEMRAGLRQHDLGGTKRVAFYNVGAATALLLDRARSDWRTAYFSRPFSLDGLMH